MSDTITVVGNIATTPDNRTTSTGVQITTFRVASTQRRLDRVTGRWEDVHTNWFSVSAYRGLAEHAFTSLHKGDRVVLTGRLRVRNWDNGTRQGTAVDIDAEAIGHDLQWGTTVFSKDEHNPGSAVAPHTDTWATAPVPGTPAAGRSDGGWSVPGADPARPVDATAAASRADAGLSAANADDAGALDPEVGLPERELVAADTPF